MIYLIDDNQNNHRESIGIDFIQNEVYADILTSVEKIEKRPLSDLSHLEFLKSAKCILLHYSTEDYDFDKNSFISGSRSNAVKTLEFISDYGDNIPLVLFSNGMGEAVLNNKEPIKLIRELNKNVFYSRLLPFLEHYKSSGEVEMRILAWGEKFISKEVSRLSNSLLDTIAFFEGTDSLDMDIFINQQLQLYRFIELSVVKDNVEEVLKNITTSSMTINEFRDKINQTNESFLKYGKNIYPWK